MNKWVNGQASLRAEPDPEARKILDIPERAVVELMDERNNMYERVFYRTGMQTYIGWVYMGWLEDYCETLPKDCVKIPDQTPDPRDAEQYAYINGIRQTNLCGEICAAYILGMPLVDVLANWKREKPGIWHSIFKSGKARGTSWDELASILAHYGYVTMPMQYIMKDMVIARPRYTVAGIQEQLTNGCGLIAGVTIDYSGRLKYTGTPHWVVITEVLPERSGYGLVRIYNPFPNRIEVYSWNEFIQSAKVPAGVCAWTLSS